MGQSSFNAALAPRRVVERATPARRRGPAQNEQSDSDLKLAELQKDYADLHTAIFEAAHVHRRLCAPRLLRYHEFEIASEIFAVRHLPGDFFTAEETNDGLVLALGDICGKGLAAGMWTTQLVGLLKSHTASASGPERIVAGVNQDICRMPLLRPLASLFLARLDVVTGALDYCSAGHPPAFLLRANGEFESLTDGGLLLGVLNDAKYCGGQARLESKDTLLIFSDGIVESQNERGEEFGYERLKAQFASAQSASAEAILFSVLGAVQDFAAIRPLTDDMTLAVIRRNHVPVSIQ
ncbi:MAG: PP2C family protein-serine/threonine phosphatase [Pyrinomonadaceae bacterium]